MHSLLQRLHAFHPTFHEQMFLSTFLLWLPKFLQMLSQFTSTPYPSWPGHSFRLSSHFQFSDFQLTPQTLYQHYLHAANSHLVPEHKLIPHTGICLQAAYAHHTLSDHENRFHEYCIPDRYVCFSSFDNEHYASYEGVIATLCFDRNRWWCNFCDRPLFISTQCLVGGVGQ